MKLEIFPSKALSSVCDRVEDVITDLVPDLHDADFLRVLHHGAGLAANQLGILEQWWVMPYDEVRSCAIVNPTVVGIGQKVEMTEGCLSLPGHAAKVMRYPEARVTGVRVVLSGPADEPEKYEDFDEVWTGIEAQLAQHEFDHLNGKLYTHLLSGANRSRIHGEVRKAKIQRKI